MQDPRNFQSARQPSPLSAFERTVDANTGDVAIARFLDATATVCVVPSQIDGRPVTAIADGAFRNTTSLNRFPFRKASEPLAPTHFMVARRSNRSTFRKRLKRSAQARSKTASR